MEGKWNRFRTDQWFKLPKQSKFPEELHPFPCGPRLCQATCGKHCLGAKQTVYDSSTDRLSAGSWQETPWWWYMTGLLLSASAVDKHMVKFSDAFLSFPKLIAGSIKLLELFKRMIIWSWYQHGRDVSRGLTCLRWDVQPHLAQRHAKICKGH